LTGEIFRRSFAPKGGSRHEHRRHEEETGNNDERPQELELEHQIRLRAYELYEARGREDGHDLEDWLPAKEEILSEEIRIAA
jgi:hypothetical protein